MDILYEKDTFDGSTFFERTMPLDLLHIPYRQAVKDFREKYYNNANIKNPTDIIIFTDAYSYSATSIFIKSLQTSGGAITVGYYGNPKIEGIDKFDASQSPSQVEELKNTNMYQELFNLGILINGVTTGENYYFYQDNLYGQIPGEYTFDPVDYRINIYSDYNDNIYNDFIQEGLKIHEKFNKKNYCNSKNKKLLLHNDDCDYIEGKNYAHGGYECNDNNEWEKSKCKPYYCDFDYYFDQIQNKCIKDCEFSNVKSTFIFEDNFDEEFIIEPKKTYYFIFVNNEDDIAYCIIDYSGQFAKNRAIGCYKEGTVRINNNNNYNNYKVKIKSIKTKINFISSKKKTFSYSFINEDSKETMLFLQNEQDGILYLDNIFKNPEAVIKMAKYDDNMNYEDIVTVNSQYFSDYSQDVSILEKDELYLLYVNFEELDQFHIFSYPVINDENVEIYDKEINILYLIKDKKYKLDFKKNTINRMIKLSRETIESEIIIEGQNIILNKENLYYQIEDNYKGELILNVIKDNALIEFLFKQPDEELEIFDLENIGLDSELEIFKKYNVIKIPKKYEKKIINLELVGNLDSNFTMYLGYIIPPYNYFSIDIEENIFSFYDFYQFSLIEHYKGDIKLMKDEYYCIMYENLDSDSIILNIKIEDEKKSIIDRISKLKGWQIALIVIGSILGLILLIIVIILIKSICKCGLGTKKKKYIELNNEL